MNNLQIIEHRNERVLTTQQLAEIYETSANNIKNNFNNNKDRFIKGRDYYLLKGNDLKEFLQVINIDLQNKSKIRSMYLWTERGANRHSKILDTDQAWKQFDVLEETYFKVKEHTYQIPTTPMEALRLMFEVQAETDQRLINLENNMTIDTSQQYHLEKLVKSKVIRLLGGKDTSAYLKYSKKVFAQLWRDYKDYFKISSYRDTLKSKYAKAEQYILNWQPDYNLMIEINASKEQ